MTPIQEYILADSDRRDHEQERLRNAWEQGWHACQAALGDVFEEGFTAGLMALKAAQHSIADGAALEVTRWGPGGRAHFADPRPGDYQGGPVAPW